METTSEHTEEEVRTIKPHVSKFMALDTKYFVRWLTRTMTHQEVREGKCLNEVLFVPLVQDVTSCSVSVILWKLYCCSVQVFQLFMAHNFVINALRKLPMNGSDKKGINFCQLVGVVVVLCRS